MSVKIAVSILDADFSNLARDLKMVKNADILHLDVMDGVFVNNLTFGPSVIRSLKKHVRMPIDIHLMIANPEKSIKEYIGLSPNYISFHFEATNFHSRLIDEIKGNGIKAGVAINPETELRKTKKIIDKIDYVLIMSVKPGFGGQKFLEDTISKIKEAKEYITAKNLKCLIEVDGGINSSNINRIVKSGADIIVCGSFIFSSKKPYDKILELRNASEKV